MGYLHALYNAVTFNKLVIKSVMKMNYFENREVAGSFCVFKQVKNGINFSGIYFYAQDKASKRGSVFEKLSKTSLQIFAIICKKYLASCVTPCI